MKKLIAILLIVMMALALCACEQQERRSIQDDGDAYVEAMKAGYVPDWPWEEAENVPPAETPEPTPEPTAEPEEAPAPEVTPEPEAAEPAEEVEDTDAPETSPLFTEPAGEATGEAGSPAD